jgi:Transposase, Mutator family
MISREDARRMIAMALDAEIEQYVAGFVEELDEDGKRRVVRHGRARERKDARVRDGADAGRRASTTSASTSRTGRSPQFSSRILPAYARRSPKVTEVLPILYLHGLSTGGFGRALTDLLGEEASWDEVEGDPAAGMSFGGAPRAWCAGGSRASMKRHLARRRHLSALLLSGLRPPT